MAQNRSSLSLKLDISKHQGVICSMEYNKEIIVKRMNVREFNYDSHILSVENWSNSNVSTVKGLNHIESISKSLIPTPKVDFFIWAMIVSYVLMRTWKYVIHDLHIYKHKP